MFQFQLDSLSTRPTKAILQSLRQPIRMFTNVSLLPIEPGEGIFEYIKRTNNGQFDLELYKQLIGCGNEFKEGDVTVGVCGASETSRQRSRGLLSNTTIQQLHNQPIHRDSMQELIWENVEQKNGSYANFQSWSLGKVKDFLLNNSNSQQLVGILNPHVISCLVKLMSNEELGKVSQKIYNPQTRGYIGSNGWLGARIQPNSPTDDGTDILFQVLNGFSFSIGDALIGTNPVDSTYENILNIELVLKDIVETFDHINEVLSLSNSSKFNHYGDQNMEVELLPQRQIGEHLLPWSVLSHIDIQREIEMKNPGSTSFWFQSIAGTDSANQTFGLTLKKLLKYAEERRGLPYSFYFETGQGSDFTNGHGHGFDMVTHESNKYALARVINERATGKTHKTPPYMVVNDVCGFLGPECFRTKEQLLRTALEDIFMGKLNGVTIGLDICSTLHMDVTVDDLEWVQNEIVNYSSPGYTMALPTRTDPMLSYLTTSFQDNLRMRELGNFHVNPIMKQFFQRIGIIDIEGKPTIHFGDTSYLYYIFRKIGKNDRRSKKIIIDEAKKIMKGLKVPIAPSPFQELKQAVENGDVLRHQIKHKVSKICHWEIDPKMKKHMDGLYKDSRLCLFSKAKPEFFKKIDNLIKVKTLSKNQNDFILHPSSGEKLHLNSIQKIKQFLEKNNNNDDDIQIIISEGLNSNSITDENHLFPFLKHVRTLFQKNGISVNPNHFFVDFGRVRAGYQIGKLLFQNSPNKSKKKGICYIVGERPGSGHHNFSIYLIALTPDDWKNGKADHNNAKVVSGVSDTATPSKEAAKAVVDIMKNFLV
ncbi:ethanolamine ammonia-lyase heavy chain [Anaeramoeba flamelloides]|uniref:Ethanolamine ammonia-lyase heavy chain n=1 Tax=Anaeramoeba flamelloides TaxID=1746091 RepID=A0AAV7ZZ64_9EUKA|nr:ethanolamine ammonia-lyase heavy chain [Anaeramoeba flamelloides]KAJ6249896.1 ethanolamine ammonia-lyase heavy chain [Anaeramoeba flamelloides]|eukprot:Anaeramoba_flamelloidesa325567_106.p1 GENE.a325567_106~~a325567_106.p1  ORF type:complete len:817 (+),score=217.82 a325567_106:51-2501(+)